MGLGSRTRDPGSRKNLFRIPIQGSKRHRTRIRNTGLYGEQWEGTCIKFASAGDRTRVACVTGGHSTFRAVKTVVGATHLTAREGSNPPPQNLPQPVEISITIQQNSMGPTQQYWPWILLIYIYIKLPIDH